MSTPFLGPKGTWIPDIGMIAHQLIEDYRAGGEYQGSSDALGTLDSWKTTAWAHGEDFTEDDWVALVQELARRAASVEQP